VISQFIYFDGFSSVTADLITPITLQYAILKDMPNALVEQLVTGDSSVTFDVTVTDPDSAITSQNLVAVVYEVGSPNNIIGQANVNNNGELNNLISGLTESTDYELVINGNYDLLNGAPVTDGSISLIYPFTTVTNQEVVVIDLQLVSTPTAITIDSASFTGGFNNIMSGEVLLTPTNGGSVVTYSLSANQIIEIKSGSIVSPILLSNNLETDTAYEITFEFTSLSGAMNVTQFTTNTIMTRKLAPSLNNINLNGSSFIKNSSSLLTADFANPNAANILNITINGQAAIVDNSSTPTNVVVTQNIGNVASVAIDDMAYIVTSFTYFDGFENQLITIAPETVNYTVLKDVPNATVTFNSVDELSIDFATVVTDADSAITSANLTATVYTRGTNNVVNTAVITNPGALNTIIDSLVGGTDYDLVISGSYNILNGTPVTDSAISLLYPFTTAANDTVIVDNIDYITTTNGLIINSADFTGGLVNIETGKIIIKEVATVPLN